MLSGVGAGVSSIILLLCMLFIIATVVSVVVAVAVVATLTIISPLYVVIHSDGEVELHVLG